MENCKQYNLFLEENGTKVLYIKLRGNNNEFRSKKWIAGHPWWDKWQLTDTSPFKTGMYNARLIKWGDAKTKPGLYTIK